MLADLPDVRLKSVVAAFQGSAASPRPGFAHCSRLKSNGCRVTHMQHITHMLTASANLLQQATELLPHIGNHLPVSLRRTFLASDRAVACTPSCAWQAQAGTVMSGAGAIWCVSLLISPNSMDILVAHALLSLLQPCALSACVHACE